MQIVKDLSGLLLLIHVIYICHLSSPVKEFLMSTFHEDWNFWLEILFVQAFRGCLKKHIFSSRFFVTLDTSFILISRQGMTDRRSRDQRSERRSLFRDREVIADLQFKKWSQGDRDRKIWRSRSCDRAILF